MDLGLRGKVALVAASSKGMGKATAMGLAAEGARVAMCARGGDDLRKAADVVRTLTGAEAFAVPADVTKAEDVRTLVQKTVQAFGAIHILVNNAGGPPAGKFDEMDDAKWQAAFELNLLSTIRLIREVLPHMRKAGGGRIINIQSSSVKQPIENLILSNAIRPGVVGLSKTLASELARDKITINTVCPGRILTDRFRSLAGVRAQRGGKTVEAVLAEQAAEVPLGYLGQPEDVANMIVYLASEQARYVTGATIQVDGGLVRGLL